MYDKMDSPFYHSVSFVMLVKPASYKLASAPRCAEKEENAADLVEPESVLTFGVDDRLNWHFYFPRSLKKGCSGGFFSSSYGMVCPNPDDKRTFKGEQNYHPVSFSTAVGQTCVYLRVHIFRSVESRCA